MIELDLAVASGGGERFGLNRVRGLLVHGGLDRFVGVLVGARDRAIVRGHRICLGQPDGLVDAVLTLNSLEYAVHAVDVVGGAIQIQRHDIVVIVVARGRKTAVGWS